MSYGELNSHGVLPHLVRTYAMLDFTEKMLTLSSSLVEQLTLPSFCIDWFEYVAFALLMTLTFIVLVI